MIEQLRAEQLELEGRASSMSKQKPQSKRLNTIERPKVIQFEDQVRVGSPNS